MEPGEEQLDYEDEDFLGGGVGYNRQFQRGAALSTVAEEELAEEEEYDELYNDLNVVPLHERIDGNNAGHSLKTQLGKGSQGDYLLESNSTGLERESGYGSIGAMSSTALPVAGGNIMQENPTLYEDDESAIVWSAQVTNLYDKGEGEADNLDVISDQLHSFSGPKVDHSSKSWGDQGNPKASQSNVEATELVQCHARNGIAGLGESSGLGKTGGLSVAVSSMKVGVSLSATPSLRAGTLAFAASSRDSFQTAPNEFLSRHDGPSLHSDESGGTILFVGDLHWWTTDADLEAAISKYGRVKELKFFEEKASGKSKGYCQVEFYDHATARTCMEGMNGQIFNGRPCVVALAAPRTIRQLGAARQQRAYPQQHQSSQAQTQSRRMINDRGGSASQSGEGGHSYGKMGLGRNGHGQGVGGRGQGGQGRGRTGIGGKSTGGIGGASSGCPYGQALQGPMGGTPAGMMHPQGMMAQGFNTTFGPYGGGGGGYAGFTSHGASVPGMNQSFSSVGSAGIPGVAPHINPAFFGTGMASNGIGTLANAGMNGHQTRMWMDSSMSGWRVEDHKKKRLTNYAEGAASEYGYGELNPDRGRSTATSDSERRGDSDRMQTCERSSHDERETGWNRDSYSDDRNVYRDQRRRDQDWEKGDEWQRERPLDQRRRDQDWEKGDEWHRERPLLNRSRGRTMEERGRGQDWEKGDEWQREKPLLNRSRGRTLEERGRDQVWEKEDQWEREKPSLNRNRVRNIDEEDQWPRSKDVNYRKKRRLPSERNN